MMSKTTTLLLAAFCLLCACSESATDTAKETAKDLSGAIGKKEISVAVEGMT